MKSLNADSLKIVANLYDSKPVFRQGLDRLLHDEVKSAVELSDRLAKFMASDAESSRSTTTVKKAVKKAPTGKKRGRPLGSRNTPKTPKTEPTEGEVLTEAKLTHGGAILEVLKDKAEGLTASEILESISSAKFNDYSLPSKATLQTTLVGLKDRKVLKTKGSRPNTKYLLK